MIESDNRLILLSLRLEKKLASGILGVSFTPLVSLSHGCDVKIQDLWCKWDKACY
jgi:hypothetical protein